MIKNYIYDNISIAVDDDTKVYLTVEFISDGNTGVTIINPPEGKAKKIIDAGTKYIGLGKNLKSSPVIVVSDIANPIPEEDEITVHYKINGDLILEHSNAKSETKRAGIIIFIKFT